jgi:hypothetical protein
MTHGLSSEVRGAVLFPPPGRPIRKGHEAVRSQRHLAAKKHGTSNPAFHDEFWAIYQLWKCLKNLWGLAVGGFLSVISKSVTVVYNPPFMLYR